MWQTAQGRSARYIETLFLLAILMIASAFVLPNLLVVPLGLEPLTAHMAGHILVMNFIAPIAALVATRTLRHEPKRSGVALDSSGMLLGAAMLAQLAALWFWHIPFAHHAAMTSSAGHVLMVTSLAGSAVWFWMSVFNHRGAARWRSMVALLITGKLFCLLGALITFAPNAIYGHSTEPAAVLLDQQTAGLLMLAVCPLTYVLAGIVISAQWLRELSAREAVLLPVPRYKNDGGIA